MRTARLVVLFVVLSFAPARADTGQFGLGLIVGQPTGITGAYELSDHTALDAALGLGFFNDRNFYAHLEFDYYLPTLIRWEPADLSAYVGIGGFFIAHNDPGFGARAPFGLSLDFNNAPIQVFLEASLLLLIVPDSALDVRGALGFRYYF
jgi:hypothetical protein